MGYDPMMFKRQRTGSVVCPSCGNLVGVNDERCYNCGRRNPGMFGFAPLLRRLGNDFGFTPIVIGACAVLYVLTLVASGRNIGMNGLSFLSPDWRLLFFFGSSGAGPVFGYGRWWTILTAGWLHGSFLHILFNMMWVRDLVPPTAKLFGASRVVIIYTVAGALGFLLSSVAFLFFGGIPIIGGALNTVGASGPSSACSARWCATVTARAAAWSGARHGPGPPRCSCSACSCRAWTTGRTRAASSGDTWRRSGSIR